jgi:5-methylcytosine-specific restriction endonuclease McrA
MASRRGNPRTKQSYKKARMAVLFRDQFTCAYCGQVADQVDHVVPLKVDNSLANAISVDNLVACCKRCNTRKNAKPLAVFLADTATPPDFPKRISLAETVAKVHLGPMTKES